MKRTARELLELVLAYVDVLKDPATANAAEQELRQR